MADRLDLLFGILLDKAAQRDTQRGLADIQKEIEGLDDQDLNELAGKMNLIGEAAQSLEDQFRATRQEAQQLAQTSQRMAQVSALIFAAGASIVGGIAFTAQSYVKYVEQAGIKGDETAERWVAASKRIQNAQLNLGEEAAQAILPVYEKAAELAEKAAQFVNENPDLIKIALNTGLVVATLGAVGIAVSRGIKIYADFKYLAATAEYSLATTRFQQSVREYLTGSLVKGGGAGATGAGALTGAAKTLGTITLLASAVIIGAEAGSAIGNALGRLVYGQDYKKQGLGDAALTATRVANAPLALFAAQLEKLGGTAGKVGDAIGDNLTRIDQFVQNLLGIKPAADDANAALEQTQEGLRDFAREANLARATEAYIQYRQQEALAEQQYMKQRAQVVEDGARQIAQIEENYAEQRADIIKSFERASGLAAANFARQQRKAVEDFNRQEARAQQDYQRQRAELIDDYHEQEREAEEDHQREMQRMEEDHYARLQDLAANRDALGIVRANREFAREQQRAEEDFQEERTRSRQENRRRLQEMDQQFHQERARRREEFERRQQEAVEEFQRQRELERMQLEERLAEMEEDHKKQLEASRQQTAERLRDLQEQYRQEQITRRNAFFDIIRDLDANLLNEQKLRLQYYARMQADLIRFLGNASGSLRGTTGVKPGSNLPGYQSGGYTPEGAIRSHAGEFVMTKETAQAMESMVGGRLSQQNIISAASGGKSLRVSVGPIYFDGRISAADRVEIAKIAQDAALSGTLRALKER